VQRGVHPGFSSQAQRAFHPRANYAGACERVGDASRCHMERSATGRGTHTGDPHRGPTGDPHRGEGPTEDPPPEGRATRGTHTEHTQTQTSGSHEIHPICRHVFTGAACGSPEGKGRVHPRFTTTILRAAATTSTIKRRCAPACSVFV